MDAEATYEIADVLSTHIVIRDVGFHDRQLSVTNDVERVVAALVESCRLRRGMRLFYYDDAGDLDEIVVHWQAKRGKGGEYHDAEFVAFKRCLAKHHWELPALLEREGE